MTTPPLPTPITPTPEQEPLLFNAIGNANHSLREIADAFGCTVESLSLWMALPEIAARLSSTDSITTWRTRLVAQAQLCKVVSTCSHILDNFNKNPRFPLDLPAAPASAPSSEHPTSHVPHHTSPVLLYIRRAENARRAATLLLRLARLTETPRTHRAADRATNDRATTLTALSQGSAVNPTRPDRAESHPTIDSSPDRPAAPAPPPVTTDHPHTPAPAPARLHSGPNPVLAPDPNLRFRSPTYRSSPPPRSPARLLATAGAGPHEHWP